MKRVWSAVRYIVAFVVAFAAVLHVGSGLIAVGRYIAFGLQYGDWLNDWLMELPRFTRQVVIMLH